MRRWIKWGLAVIGVLLAAVLGYGFWAFGHPAMPRDAETLSTGVSAGGGVTAHYFGTTTLAFDDGHDAVMIDALISRPSITKALFGKVSSDPVRIDKVLGRAALSKLDLLLVTHTHFDHALDIAPVAKRTGARVVGSPSTREVAIGGGISDARILVIHGGELLHAGGFTVTVFKSLHSLGDRVPGEVTAPLHQPATIKDYKEGGTYAYLIEHRGLRILVHASANVVPGMYRGVKADVLFLATGGLSTQPLAFTRRYWRETVEETGAKLVVPIHWDDFFRPLDQPLKPLPRMMDNVPLTMKRIAPLAARDHVAVRYMPVIAPVDLTTAARAAAQGS